MRICMVGAHRVGKTSLAERLGVELELKMVYTKLSEIVQNHFGINTAEANQLKGEMGFGTRLMIQERYTAHIQALLGDDNVILDRSLFDVVAYSEDSLSRIVSEGDLGDYYIKLMNAHVRLLAWHANKLGDVDFFVYVQPGIEFDEDAKSWDEDSQKWIDRVIYMHLHENLDPKRIITIPRDMVDFEERVNFVMREISLRTC